MSNDAMTIVVIVFSEKIVYISGRNRMSFFLKGRIAVS